MAVSKLVLKVFYLIAYDCGVVALPAASDSAVQRDIMVLAFAASRSGTRRHSSPRPRRKRRKASAERPTPAHGSAEPSIIVTNSSMEQRHVIANAKLVLRAKPSLNSQKIGEVLPGSALVVIEELMLVLEESPDDSGIGRARVGKESWPRGVTVEPLGWVTSLRDGDQKLVEPDGDSMATRTARRRQDRARLRAERRLHDERSALPPLPAP